MDTKDLKKAAEAATAGVWRYGPGDEEDENPVVFVDLPQASGVAISILFEADWATDADAKFVSLANPAAVLALISERDQLKAECEDKARALAASAKDQGILTRQRNSFRAAAERLKAENEALRKDAERYRHLKATWDDGALLERLECMVLPEDWDATIDADMNKGEQS